MSSRRVRFTDDEWGAIEYAAQAEGLPASEIVRIGALSYCAFMLARRGDEMAERFDRLWQAGRDLVVEYPLR